MAEPARIGQKHTDPATQKASRRTRILAGNTHGMPAMLQDACLVGHERAAEIAERG